MTPQELLDHALEMNKFSIEQDTLGEIIVLPREQAVLMTYYRNNIHHLLVLPSLLASIILQHKSLTYDELFKQVKLIYPMLKRELFLHWSDEQLEPTIKLLLNELCRQALITESENIVAATSAQRYRTLQLLAAGVRETLQRYAITFTILSAKPAINRGTLEKESRTLAQRLSVLHGINAPEFFDKAVFTGLVLTLRDEGYISDRDDADIDKSIVMRNLLLNLMNRDVRQTIENSDNILPDNS